MTSLPRDRVLSSLAHREPDQLAIDFGGMRSTGINAIAYGRLKRHIGVSSGAIRVYDIFQQLAEPEPEVLDRMGGDVVQLHRLCPSFGIPITEWKPDTLDDGTPCLVPAGLNPVRTPDGDLLLFHEKTLIATKPKSSDYYNPVHHPLADVRTPEDLDRTKVWRISEEELSYLRDTAARLRQTGYAVLASFGGNILEAGQLDFGYERFMYMLGAEPDLCRHYFERITAGYMDDLPRYLEAVGDNIDVIQFGDDLGSQSGPQISTRMYKNLIKPYHQAQYQYVRKHSKASVFLHCCGGVWPLIPELIDAGVQVLNPVQISAKGMDPAELKREFGKDLVFWGGGANMQTFVPTATVDEVRDHVRKLIDIFAPGGGFVFNQVHNIQANVPPEKILAIYDTALERR